MQNIRILALPDMRAAYSGALVDGARFEAFNRWFSGFHASLRNELHPRDFMRYNERIGAREWFYALPEGECDAGGFEMVTLPGGLFAVASCLNADLDGAADWMQTFEALRDWANASERFRPYQNGPGRPEKYAMFQIVSPGELMAEGISMEDLYFPIEVRA